MAVLGLCARWNRRCSMWRYFLAESKASLNWNVGSWQGRGGGGEGRKEEKIKKPSLFQTLAKSLTVFLAFLCIHQPDSLLYAGCSSSSPLAPGISLVLVSFLVPLAPGTFLSILPGISILKMKPDTLHLVGKNLELTVTHPCRLQRGMGCSRIRCWRPGITLHVGTLHHTL